MAASRNRPRQRQQPRPRRANKSNSTNASGFSRMGGRGSFFIYFGMDDRGGVTLNLSIMKTTGLILGILGGMLIIGGK
jgi:hypothetical protein